MPYVLLQVHRNESGKEASEEELRAAKVGEKKAKDRESTKLKHAGAEACPSAGAPRQKRQVDVAGGAEGGEGRGEKGQRLATLRNQGTYELMYTISFLQVHRAKSGNKVSEQLETTKGTWVKKAKRSLNLTKTGCA